ncbi:MAG: MFS transporter, partial [Gammaproteobacteria bacterium]
KRKRVTLMMLVSCGFTVGAVLGGLLSAFMIPRWGWQSVFYFGGIFPLILVVLMYFLLPESMQFLVLRGRHPERVGAFLKRIDATVRIDERTRYLVHEVKQSGATVVELFRHGRAKTTALLWAVNFLNLLNLYFLSNWLPTIAASAGLSASNAVLVGTSLQVGGVIGTLAMGPIIDRVGFMRVLVPSFLVAGVAITLIGQAGIPLALLFVIVLIAGFCIVGGQPAVNALAATYYPTTLRSTGVGWSLGVGRVGSVVGPVLGGELIRLNWSDSALFIAVVVPAVISALLMLAIGRGISSDGTPHAESENRGALAV